MSVAASQTKKCSRLQNPPYSRLLNDRRSNRNTWWLLIGSDGWQWAKAWTRERHRPFTLCPPGDDPFVFDWSIYRDAPAPVGLVRCGAVVGSQVQALVTALLESGSPRVFDMLADAVYVRAGA